MIQQGQVFKLKTKGADGQPLWAYRYRLEGRGSERPQVGGFATRAEAETALCEVLDRLGPGGGRATITLAEFVDEYLEMRDTASRRRRRCGKFSTALSPGGCSTTTRPSAASRTRCGGRRRSDRSKHGGRSKPWPRNSGRCTARW